ncbi:MAG: hypothetical protein E7214_13950 [Clostridium sp.]|nr:hypothetical protein [Clostridium sp.]
MFGKAYSNISKQSLRRHKEKLKDILNRSKPVTLEQRINKLNQMNIGWINYYGVAKCKGYWRVANSAILNTTLTNQFFTDLGLKSLTRQYIKIH